ncbi:MAG: LacI family DNA-binding transcriptional regulator [Lacunisphaera sp.]
MPAPRTTPTLHAVARIAGVSVSTASRCLSGAAKVAKSTERRILAAAKATGYHHNILVGQVMRATRLGAAQNHLGTIAFVTPVADAHEWRATPTLASNWEAARARAESFGFSISEFTLDSEGMTGRRLGKFSPRAASMACSSPPSPPNRTGFRCRGTTSPLSRSAIA